MWGTVDAFHYAWKRVSGDFAISADVRFVGEGVAINSDFLNGMVMKAAVDASIKKMESMDIGSRQVNYKMRDAGCRAKRETILVLIACLLAVAVPVLAQSSASYDLSWHEVGGGGGRLEGVDYTLLGTIGQVDAGVLVGSEYTLRGGFWPGGAQIYRIYLPLVLSQYP